MNRLQCCRLDSPVLREITLVDTPGILSGEKQSLDRGYDYTAVRRKEGEFSVWFYDKPSNQVMEWFAARVDRILILFDANKLDISDELRRAIQALKTHDEKVKKNI